MATDGDLRRGTALRRGSGIPAFTLTELLISLAILAVISAISISAVRSVGRIVDVNRADEKAQRAVRWFVERLDAELSGTLYARGLKETSFEARRHEVAGKDVHDLAFATLSPVAFFEPGARDEVVRVVYEVTGNEGREDRLVLTKKVFHRLLAPETERVPFETVIRDDFTSFSLRFYKGGRWYESWDTETMNFIPDGVELTFSLGEGTFREYFNIFMSGN